MAKTGTAGIAQEFARSGIRCYLFAEPTPVPVVSFAIRQLGLNGGVMITASHNTKEYNGYKVYDHFGNQIDDRKAALIEQYMEAEPTFCEGVPKDLTEAQKEGTISFLEEDIKEAYLAALQRETLWWNEDIEHCKKALGGLRICYTPLNGSGRDYVLAALERVGVREILRVSESRISGNLRGSSADSRQRGGARRSRKSWKRSFAARDEDRLRGLRKGRAKMAGPAFSDRSGQ